MLLAKICFVVSNTVSLLVSTMCVKHFRHLDSLSSHVLRSDRQTKSTASFGSRKNECSLVVLAAHYSYYSTVGEGRLSVAMSKREAIPTSTTNEELRTQHHLYF